ncbi:hypothetical protein E2C01_077696 [Portunus trituberculatus]|uniref:Uncharacterized protein n=1 Tax=Portunus trituberculatus TaxID=210409 RepID=A0A5B7IMR0_PORTR|nr:hypothetical protein [Portunus trituberculatus]
MFTLTIICSGTIISVIRFIRARRCLPELLQTYTSQSTDAGNVEKLSGVCDGLVVNMSSSYLPMENERAHIHRNSHTHCESLMKTPQYNGAIDRTHCNLGANTCTYFIPPDS